MASGIPLTALLLRGLPQADGSAGAVDRYAASYAALLFIMGTLVSWPQVRATLLLRQGFRVRVIPNSNRKPEA